MGRLEQASIRQKNLCLCEYALLSNSSHLKNGFRNLYAFENEQEKNMDSLKLKPRAGNPITRVSVGCILRKGRGGGQK